MSDNVKTLVKLKIASGLVYGGAVATTVAFPVGLFSAVPNLIVWNQDSAVSLPVASSITATQFIYENTLFSNASLNWIAIQLP